MKKTTERGIPLPPEIHNDLMRREFLVAAGLVALVPGCGSGEEGGAKEILEAAIDGGPETEVPS